MTQHRTPAGVPTGGQFAASARGEAHAPLDGPADTYSADGRLLRRADQVEGGDLVVSRELTSPGQPSRILTVFRIDEHGDGRRTLWLAPIKGKVEAMVVQPHWKVEIFDGELADGEEDLDEWGDYDEDEDEEW